MIYRFASIITQEDPDQTWVPRVVDKWGGVGWLPQDGHTQRFSANGMTVYYGGVSRASRLLWVRDVDITVYVSRARLVAVCRRYDKGGGWWGTDVASVLVFNAVSMARARLRSHGRFLVGQVWWPWLADVGYTTRTGWQSSSKIRLVAYDGGGGQWVYADLQLPRQEDSRRVAGLILDAAVAARARQPHLRDEHREQIAAVRLPGPAIRDRFAVAAIPGAHRAVAGTEAPERLTTSTLVDTAMRADAARQAVADRRSRQAAQLLLADGGSMAL